VTAISPGLATLGYRWDWAGFPNPAGGERVSILEPFADAVAMVDTGGKVTVLEATSGRSRWSAEVANRLTRFTGLSRSSDPAKSNVLLVSTEPELFLMNMGDGNLAGRERFEKVVNTSPVLMGNLAIYGTFSGEILAHAVRLNVKAWGFDMPAAVEFPPVVVGGAIAGISNAGHVTFVDAQSGSMLGRNKLFAGIACNPCAAGDLLIVASLDQSVYAIDTSGAVVWRHRTAAPLRSSPAVHAGAVLLSIPGEGLTALSADRGKVLWSTSEVSGDVIGVRGGRLVVWDGRILSTVEPGSGSLVDRAELPGVKILKTDKFEDGALYLVNDKNVAAKFIPR
jgi:outer membrane protein assembly factor BamB